jgi:hypothetical protein
MNLVATALITHHEADTMIHTELNRRNTYPRSNEDDWCVIISLMQTYNQSLISIKFSSNGSWIYALKYFHLCLEI